jgi:hypothetical protein
MLALEANDDNMVWRPHFEEGSEVVSKKAQRRCLAAEALIIWLVIRSVGGTQSRDFTFHPRN